MRARWSRPVPALTPTPNDIRAMVRAGLPDAHVTGFAATEGGLANTNIRIDLEDRRVLLRLYQRGAAEAGKEAAIAQRLDGIVPVARFLHLGDRGGQRFALLEWIEGVSLDTALADRTQTASLGRAAGAMLSRIHAVHFEQTGFLDENLRIARPFTADKAFLAAYLRGALVEGGGARFVPRDLADAVLAYAVRNSDLAWGGRPCLVHGDYNGSNILVHDDAIAAVLDWEFAFAGSPAPDFGNLLRNHPDPAFQDAAGNSYRDGGGVLPNDWRKQARIADLLSWADFLSRPKVDPALTRDALRSLRETIAMP